MAAIILITLFLYAFLLIAVSSEVWFWCVGVVCLLASALSIAALGMWGAIAILSVVCGLGTYLLLFDSRRTPQNK